MNIITGEELTLSAFSKDDYDNWIRAIKKLKEETDRRKKDIEKKHQIQDLAEAERVSKSNKRNDMKTAEFSTIDLGLDK